jgi:quercetin dioxygenase-like cupin family protein
MVILNKSVVSAKAGEGIERKILASCGKLMTVEVKFKKDAAGDQHSHPHEQISYVIKGSFEFIMEGNKYILNAGDSYYVKPDAVHGIKALVDSVLIDVFTPQREDFLK